MMLSPFDPYPVARPLSVWDDPFLASDVLSPFSLLPSLTAPLDVLPPAARIVSGDNNELMAVFDGLEGCARSGACRARLAQVTRLRPRPVPHPNPTPAPRAARPSPLLAKIRFDDVNVSVDEGSSSVTIRARDSAGTTCASRWITLPCDLQNAGKITAEHIGGSVVVTVPQECQKAIEQQSEAQKARPLKVTLRPAVKGPSPQFETNQDDKGFHIKVSNVKKEEDPNVHVDGSRLRVTCKAAQGDAPFSRVFRLPRTVKDADSIDAKFEGDCLCISVPDNALEAPKEPVSAEIKVKKQ